MKIYEGNAQIAYENMSNHIRNSQEVKDLIAKHGKESECPLEDVTYVANLHFISKYTLEPDNIKVDLVCNHCQSVIFSDRRYLNEKL